MAIIKTAHENRTLACSRGQARASSCLCTGALTTGGTSCRATLPRTCRFVQHPGPLEPLSPSLQLLAP